MDINIRMLIGGILSWLRLKNVNRHHVDGTYSARYCYTVWMRHMKTLYENGFPHLPNVIAELGPGYSIGTGLAGLLSCADHYYALDVCKYSIQNRNIEIFDELVELFRNRVDIPGDDEFPRVKPKLKSYSFPDHIFSKDHMELLLQTDRIQAIRNALQQDEEEFVYDGKPMSVKYCAPWFDSNVIRKESVDLIFSQAVMEHVEDVENVYRTLRQWLKPDGYMSHEIDFKCHGTANTWNGHWSIPDFVFSLMKGRRTYLINREPLSRHKEYLHQCGFQLVADSKEQNQEGISREQLAPRFQNLTEEDLITQTAHIISRKAGQ